MYRVLLNRSYRNFFISFTLGNFAEGLLIVTTPFLILQVIGNPSAVGIGLAAQTMGVLFTLFPGSTLSDKFSKTKIISASYILGSLALAPIFVLQAVQNSMFLLSICLFLFGVSTAIYGPISDSLTPDLVDEIDLHRANSADTFSQRIGQGIAGPLIGGLLISLNAGVYSYIIASSSLLVSAIIIRSINIPTKKHQDENAQDPSWADTLRFLKKWPLFTVLLIWVSILVMSQVGGKPVLTTTWADAYHGSLVYGSALAIGSITSLTASIIIGSLDLPKKYVLHMIAYWSIGSSVIVLLILNRSVFAFFATFVISGIFLTAGNIYWSTFIQKNVPRAILPRVISIDWFASLALVPLGAALTGLTLERVGLDNMILLISMPILLSGFIIVLLLGRMQTAPPQ